MPVSQIVQASLASGVPSSVARSALPTGSVLQVVSTTKTNIYSSNHGETWADVTGFSVNITPTSSSSRIFISVTCATSLEEQDSFAYLRLMRDSTTICIGDARGSATRASMDASQQNAGTTRVWAKPNAVQFLDSPATTSQITYKVQAWIRSGRTLFVGGTSGTDDAYRSNLPSIITVMEIAA